MDYTAAPLEKLIEEFGKFQGVGRNADKYGYAYPNGESYAILRERVQRGLRRALFLAGDAPLLIVGHQAINRVLLSLFLRQRSEDVPYIHIPQNQYYHISLTPSRKVFERIPYERTAQS